MQRDHRLKWIMRGSYFLLIGAFIALFLCPVSAWAKNRILYIDSYHAGYDWSDGITDAIKAVLQPRDAESDAGMIDLPFDRIHVGDFERWQAEYECGRESDHQFKGGQGGGNQGAQ